MLPDRVSNSGPLTYESGALPTVLPGPAAKRLTAVFSFRYLFHIMRIPVTFTDSNPKGNRTIPNT